MRESRIARRFGHPAHMPRQARCLSVRVWHHPARVRATRDLVKVITMAIHPGAQCTAPRDLELARGVLPGAESPERVAHVFPGAKGLRMDARGVRVSPGRTRPSGK